MQVIDSLTQYTRNAVCGFSLELEFSRTRSFLWPISCILSETMKVNLQTYFVWLTDNEIDNMANNVDKYGATSQICTAHD